MGQLPSIYLFNVLPARQLRLAASPEGRRSKRPRRKPDYKREEGGLGDAALPNLSEPPPPTPGTPAPEAETQLSESASAAHTACWVFSGRPLLRLHLRTPPVGGAWVFSAQLPLGAPLSPAHLH